MKKNAMMRLASVLLIAVLISTSAISGTYAKYVTTASGSDTARVAKWGVVVKADSNGMFTDKYETTDTTFTGQYSVQSDPDSGDDVLAPGTSGKFADISITGKPEVAVAVAIEADVSVNESWKVLGEFYCPVTITVGTTEISGLNYDNPSEFEAAIKAALEDQSDEYEPNTDLGPIYGNDKLGLKWEWAFEGADKDGGFEVDGQTDAKDTALGDLAVTENLVISIGVEITVTQID